MHASKLEEFVSRHRRAQLFLLGATMLVSFASSAFAGSGTWLGSPVDGDWNSAPNWSPMTVPNGPSDTATFDSSLVPDVSISANTEVNGIVFNSLAQSSPFTITAGPTRMFTVSGVGITNNSGVIQNFVTAVSASGNGGTIEFRNNAIAGSQTAFTNKAESGGLIAATTHFFDNSSAGSASINNNGVVMPPVGIGGRTIFEGTSTAGSATINNNAGVFNGRTIFFDSATAGNATINNNIEPFDSVGGGTEFYGTSTAGTATINIDGATLFSSDGGSVSFFENSSADGATITVNGTPSGGGDNVGYGSLGFQGSASAGHATLIANDSPGGGGQIFFLDNSTGGTARVKVFGNGILDISNFHVGPGVTIGSIEGTGHVELLFRNITVGSNDLSTVFSGVIEDGLTGGSLTKIGSGTLTLSGANTYTGGTTINGGVLQVDNTSGSGTGSGPVTVNSSGKLGGSGTIAGDLINGGIVAPGDSPGTLHVAGNFSQGTGGTLEIEIASLFSFDQLIVSGTATLDGTLDVTLDGYTGHAGDIFTILTSSGLSGNFLNFDLPELGNGLFFTERVTSNDVLLTVSGSTGVPDHGSTLFLMAGSLAALLGLRRCVISRAQPI